MAKAKEVQEVVDAPAREDGLIEVEHFAAAVDATFNGPGFRVHFVDGKALVQPDVVDVLKEAGLIK